MILKAACHFHHYFYTRGKAEIMSFIQSWVAGFMLVFGLLVLGQFQGLVSPEVQDTATAVFYGFLGALWRSALGGIIYACVPESIRKKIKAMLLRAEDSNKP